MKKGLKNIKLIVSLAMLSALSIIFGKYLGINAGEYLRFSLENMPIIFAGVAFGPICGATVGIVADLVGCLMVGWVPIPWVAVGAALIGAVSGAVPYLIEKTPVPRTLSIPISVFCAHLLGSVLVKTIGLSDFYGNPYLVLLLWRLLNYLIIGVIDGFILCVLLGNKGIKLQIKEIGGREL